MPAWRRTLRRGLRNCHKTGFVMLFGETQPAQFVLMRLLQTILSIGHDYLKGILIAHLFCQVISKQSPDIDKGVSNR